MSPGRLHKWRQLPASDRLLLLEALRELSIVGVALRIRPLAELKREPAAPRRAVDPVRTAWAVSTAARVVPGAACLAQALAVQRMLAARGCPSTIEFGVAKNGEALEAHAWLVCGGEVVIGGQEAAQFVRLEAP